MDLLQNYFSRLEIRKYENSLEITEADAIIKYFLSLSGIDSCGHGLDEEMIAKLQEYLVETIKRDTKIIVSKDSGIEYRYPRFSLPKK